MAIDKQQFVKQLGVTIARYRQQKGLTQEQLAEKIGIGNEAISRIERGIAMPALIRLIEFAEVFECNVADLLMPSSPRKQDEANYLSSLLQDIDNKDRLLLVHLMEQLVKRFKKN